LPDIHRDFVIFGLIVPALTILMFLLNLQWAQPATEAGTYFIIGTLWLTMGAWSTDMIGSTQCDTLRGQKTPTKNGQMNFQAYCYEMKVIQAFSWAIFCMFLIAFYILMQLVTLAQRFGRYRIWSEPIRELPWFGEMPGYYNTNNYGGGGPMMHYPPPSSAGGYGYPYQGGMPVPNPGHSIVIQPGINGALPTITQMPLSA